MTGAGGKGRAAPCLTLQQLSLVRFCCYPAWEEERLAAPPNLLLHTLTCFLHEQEEAAEVCCSAKTANVFDNDDDDTAVFSRFGGDARKRSFRGVR